MGFFGFGARRHHDDDNTHKGHDEAITDDKIPAGTEVADNGDEDTAATQVSEGADRNVGDEQDADGVADVAEPQVPTEAVESYDERGEVYGPWDVDDDEVPDYDEYLDLGAFYLPFLQGIELRIKASRASKQVLGCTITYGSSSLEIEAFAAPKTLGLWDDMRADLMAGKAKATQQPGVFGTEVLLPVVLGGKRLTTRIVGVDGPRWMLRGIFSGPASRSGSAEGTALNGFFSKIVVDRGDEPLAPRDLIPMHEPVSPAQRKAAKAQHDNEDADDNKIPERVKGPFNSDQQTEVKSTLSRGPMFSEVR